MTWQKRFEKVWAESFVSSNGEIALEGKNVKQFISDEIKKAKAEVVEGTEEEFESLLFGIPPSNGVMDFARLFRNYLKTLKEKYK